MWIFSYGSKKKIRYLAQNFSTMCRKIQACTAWLIKTGLEISILTLPVELIGTKQKNFTKLEDGQNLHFGKSNFKCLVTDLKIYYSTYFFRISDSRY